MKILTVIPIAKGVFRESLSYFTSKKIGVGALVSAPIRKKITPGIVVSARDIKDIKTSVKKSDFKLKPIKSVKAENFLAPDFIEACGEIADYFVSPSGPVIKNFIPQTILENPPATPLAPSLAWGKGGIAQSNSEIILFQAPKKERLQYYKSVIREEFAKKKSVFFCLPTAAEMDEFSPELKKGIEEYTLIMHSKMPKKKIKESWKRALSEQHPILIIVTKSFLSIPRKNIGALIIERENSPLYKSQTRPYLDIRKSAEILSSKTGMRLIFGDNVIRVETYFRFGERPVSRILSEAEQIVSDMGKKNAVEWQKTKIFSALGQDIREIIKTAKEKNENVILFAGRRGHSPTTVCNDCFRTVLCEKCDTPLVLHKKNAKTKETEFVCHKCLAKTTAPERCPYCRSWRLQTLGIGTQKIAEEISKIFPGVKLFRIDSDAVKTKKQGDEIAKNFLSNPGSVLIGTEMIFSHISSPVERVGVVSVDSLFTLPDFRINEKIFNLLLRLRMLAKKTFIIQTRMANQPLFDDVIKGNISGFYKKELEIRKQFQYPPFKTLIKITKESKNKTTLKKEIAELEENLREWNPFSYPAFTPKIKHIYSWHILLKIEPQTWPEEQKELHQILSSLPPAWKVNVDPESLL